jgi:hypothetical protein
MRTLSVTILLALTAGACGGSDGKSCSGAAPCGGEISPGRYKIASFCSSVMGNVPSAGCPAGITVASSNLSLTGTVTFNADKTYSTAGMASGSVVETIPQSCLAQGGLTLSCAQLSQLVQQDSPGSSCSGSGACTCTLVLDAQPTAATGTWATSGTTLTITPEGEAGSQSQYCATPSSVDVTSMAMNGLGMSPMMGTLMGGTNMLLTKE